MIRSIHPASFKNIVLNRKCVVREGLSYRIVEASYTAWLFSETPPSSITDIVLSNPELSRRVAIYDLSPLLDGKRMCIALNLTRSDVFHAFENYLRRELKVRLKRHPIGTEKYNVTQAA